MTVGLIDVCNTGPETVIYIETQCRETILGSVVHVRLKYVAYTARMSDL